MHGTITRGTSTVLGRRELSHGCFVLRLDRAAIGRFEPGQYVVIGPEHSPDRREYSVYSAPDEPFLEVLIKEVPEGEVSRALHELEPGDSVAIEGPLGYFTISPEHRRSREFLFIATGTGIAPFHCFVRAYSELNYRVLHGVRYAEERHEYHTYAPQRYTACITGETVSEAYHGRVTSYLQQVSVAPDTLCYLCGNCDMIFEAFDILQRHGVDPENLHAEVYY